MDFCFFLIWNKNERIIVCFDKDVYMLNIFFGTKYKPHYVSTHTAHNFCSILLDQFNLVPKLLSLLLMYGKHS